MIRNSRAASSLPLLAALLFLVCGCAGNDPRDPVTLNVSNKVAGAVDIDLVPQFDMGSSPGAENVRSLELASGQTKTIQLPRGLWLIRSTPKDQFDPEGKHIDKHAFHADGDVVIDDKLIRYNKTGPERAPELPVERRRDPTGRDER